MARDPTVRSKGYLSNKTARTGRHSGGIALLLGFAIFGLLWILHIPLREIYVPNEDDIPALADGLLLAPGAHWQDWFTRGYSHFFDLYPDWPAHGTESTSTAFTRPAFQFVIYLAHFVLGRDWASYQLINCFAVAGMGAVAFQIAQTVLGLRTGPSLVAAMLVVLSPPVLAIVAVRCRVCYRTARHCSRSRRLPCGSRSPRLSLSCVALSGATDQREHCVGASRSGHNHYVAPQAGRVAPSSGVYRCGHALTGGDVAGPSIRLLRRHWRHLCNGRIHATCGLPKAHFLQAYTYALSVHNPYSAREGCQTGERHS